MGILRSIESRLERVVEGSVGRLFRASVAPVELARKLAKELEEGKVVSVTQTYAPNEYTVFLSPRDRARFAEFEASLRNELASYLAEHARRAGYVMPTRPRVRFETESSLHTGIFGISTALVRDDDSPIEPLDAPGAAAAGAVGAAAAFSATPEPRPTQARRRSRWPCPRSPCARRSIPTRPRPGRPASPCTRSSPTRAEPAAESEPEPVAESEPSFSPHLPDAPPLVPGVPLHEDLPVPPVVPIPPVPLPDLPAMAPLPDAPPVPAGDPDVPPEPPVAEPEPEVPLVARGFDLPVDPPLEATMITRPEAREELVIVHDGQRTPIEATVVQIGRAPGCDIVLDDRNVSRRHAEIRRRGPVVVLIDLDSTNGTIVNGRRVREHPLADGDRITLGNSRLTFERRTT